MRRIRNRHESEPPERLKTENSKGVEDAEAQSSESERAEPEAGNAAASAAGKAPRTKPFKAPLWDFLDDPARDSDGTHSVVYRSEPVINRRHKEHFIGRKVGRLTQQDLLLEYGSGVYEIWCKDVNKKLLYREPVAIHHHDFPPKLDLAELVAGDPTNEVYLKTWAKKSVNGSSDKAPVAASEMDTVLRTVLEKSGSFDPKLAQLWESTATQRDELSKALAARNAPPDFAAQAKALKEVFGLFQPPAALAPAPAQALDALALVKALRDLQPKTPEPPNPLAILAQAKEIFGSPQANSSDDLARFEKFLSIADKLAGWRGGDGRKIGWDTALEFAKEAPAIVSPILQFVTNAMALNSQGRAPMVGAVPGAAAMPVAGFDPYKDQAIAAAYAASLRAQQAARASAAPAASPAAPHATAAPPTPPPPPGGAPDGQTSVELTQLLAMYGGLVLNSLNSGQRGCDFADWLVQGFGAGTHAVISQHGETALAQAMMAIPELSVYGEGRLQKFAHEFINYDSILMAKMMERMKIKQRRYHKACLHTGRVFSGQNNCPRTCSGQLDSSTL